MLGGLLAGLAESPGEVILYKGRSFKQYRGMGSLGAMVAGSKDRYRQGDTGREKLVPEGVEGRVPYKGSAGAFLYQMVGGLRAGMGYAARGTLRNYALAAGSSWSAGRPCRRAILMTSPLRRKRRTTVRGASATATTLVKVAALGLLLAGGSVYAQQPQLLPPLAPPPVPVPWQASDTITGSGLPAPLPPRPRNLTFEKVASEYQQTQVKPAEHQLTFQKLAGQAGVIIPVQNTVRPPRNQSHEADPFEYDIQLDPPESERLFGTVQSEESLDQRLYQQARQQGDRVAFPNEKPVTTIPYKEREYPPLTSYIEPNYVCYHRLYFEGRNAERYGWDLGFVQPFVSAALFYKDLALFPYNAFSRPFDRVESSAAGLCLPGDPVPYLLYPPGLSLTGALGEAGAVAGLLAIFP